MVKKLFIYAFILFYPALVHSQLRVAGIFSDNMVLQREEKIPVWGTSAPGTIIYADLCNKIVKTKTDKNGNWKIWLPAAKAGGPYTLTIGNKKETVTFQNVMLGDVWYASGQSNMEHPMQGWPWIPNSSVYRYEEEIKDSNYPEIRLFTVPKYPAANPQSDIPDTKWMIASAETLPSFSSTAWFFAKKLHTELNIPIGIINCTWAGTSIKAWMSKESLITSGESPDTANNIFPDRKEIADILKHNEERRILITYPRQEQLDSLFCLDKKHWQNVEEMNKYQSDSEISWIEKTIDIPEAHAKETLLLSLGYLKGQGNIYFNGHLLGSYSYPEQAFTLIPRNIIYPGDNSLLIRLTQPFGKTSVIGSDSIFWLRTRDNSYHYDLSKNWQTDPLPEYVPQSKDDYRKHPSALFNGMVNPIFPYSIKGIIWYQGEDDAWQPSTYKRKFESLITDYRTKWQKKNLHFLFVQLSSYKFSHEKDSPDLWGPLREAQNISLPYTTMITSIDLGDQYDVHPRNKKAFGERLALGALEIY